MNKPVNIHSPLDRGASTGAEYPNWGDVADVDTGMLDAPTPMSRVTLSDLLSPASLGSLRGMLTEGYQEAHARGECDQGCPVCEQEDRQVDPAIALDARVRSAEFIGPGILSLLENRQN